MELAIKEVHGDELSSYNILRRYMLKNLEHTDLSSHVVLDIEKYTKIVRRCFIYFEVCGFHFCHPFIFLDETFMIGKI